MEQKIYEGVTSFVDYGRIWYESGYTLVRYRNRILFEIPVCVDINASLYKIGDLEWRVMRRYQPVILDLENDTGLDYSS